MQKYLEKVFILLWAVVGSSVAQVNYDSHEIVYTQNFDVLPNSGASFTWTDNSTIPGWYLGVSNSPVGVSTGSTTTGNVYSFGSSNSTDRALGSIASGSNNHTYGLQLINNTATTITAFTVGYAGEQWRSSAAAAQSLSFQYSIGATGLKIGTYTNVPVLTFTSPVTGGTSGAINGNTAVNRVVTVPVTISNISWLPGSSLWLRFTDTDDAGFDHGLAIDDFSFSAAGIAPAYDPPSGYYDSALGLTGDELATALHGIIDNQTVLPYTSSSGIDTRAALKYLYADSLDATKIKLTYSNISILNTSTAWDREHLWPQSRGISSDGSAVSDLFNLRPVYSTVNSARGNKIFDISNPSDNNYAAPATPLTAADTSADTDSWQPSVDERGDIARSLFYMDIRYNGGDGNSLDLALDNVIVGTPSMAVIGTLLQWNSADPVSEEERRQNGLIYSLYQHNRNPFVDHPEYAAAIFGDLVTEAEDPDLDGLPSTWETTYQLDPQASTDANTDSDGDGLTNFEEYWIGSDPRNSAHPAELIVDKAYTGSFQDGSAAYPYKTIQGALDVLPVSDLSVIIVRPGIYEERPYITGKSNVHLFSEGGAAETIIDGQQINSSVVRLYNFHRASFVGFTIRNAATSWYGAGLRVEAPSGKALVSGNFITANTSTATSNGGGGLYLKTVDGSRIINNFIVGNTAARGGGVLFAAGDAQFWFNTIAGNSAAGGNGGGLSAIQGVHPDIRNNIIWGNTGGSAASQIHQISNLTQNILQGAATGDGNINSDPLFMGGGNYHVSTSSPAINAAANLPVANDFDGDLRLAAADTLKDIGADEVGGPPVLQIVGGNNQIGLPGATLPLQLSVQQFNADGSRPINGSITWEITSNTGGSISDDGRQLMGSAKASLTLPNVLNAVITVKASASNSFGTSEVVFSQTIGGGDDSDGDQMSDSWEVAKFGTLSFDGTEDQDIDGLLDYLEFLLDTNPNLRDSDGDGIADGEDSHPGIVDPSMPYDLYIEFPDWQNQTHIKISWTAGANPADGFIVEKSVDSGDWEQLGTTAGLFLEDQGLLANQHYQYRISAYKENPGSRLLSAAAVVEYDVPLNETVESKIASIGRQKPGFREYGVAQEIPTFYLEKEDESTYSSVEFTSPPLNGFSRYTGKRTLKVTANPLTGGLKYHGTYRMKYDQADGDSVSGGDKDSLETSTWDYETQKRWKGILSEVTTSTVVSRYDYLSRQWYRGDKAAKYEDEQRWNVYLDGDYRIEWTYSANSGSPVWLGYAYDPWNGTLTSSGNSLLTGSSGGDNPHSFSKNATIQADGSWLGTSTEDGVTQVLRGNPWSGSWDSGRGWGYPGWYHGFSVDESSTLRKWQSSPPNAPETAAKSQLSVPYTTDRFISDTIDSISDYLPGYGYGIGHRRLSKDQAVFSVSTAKYKWKTAPSAPHTFTWDEIFVPDDASKKTEVVARHSISLDASGVNGTEFEQKKSLSDSRSGTYMISRGIEIMSDFNNDGRIDNLDSAIHSYAENNSASEKQKKQGTEYIFANDYFSNGRWDKDDSDPDRPEWATDDDDAEALSISTGDHTIGTVVISHPAIAQLGFYKTKKCDPTEKITFPFSMSKENPLPGVLYVRAEGDITQQVEGELELKISNSGQEASSSKLTLVIVKNVGDTKFFQACGDYIQETYAPFYVTQKNYSGEMMRIVVMRQDTTKMKMLNTYNRKPVLRGIDAVVNAFPLKNVVINGNFGTSVGWSIPLETTKCQGRLISHSVLDTKMSLDSTQSESVYAGDAAYYIAQKGRNFTFAKGQVPLSSGFEEAIGGLYRHYAGAETDASTMIGYSEVDREKYVFVSVTDMNIDSEGSGNGVIGFKDDALLSGGSDVYILDGSTSSALAYTNPSGVLKTRFKGSKHSGFPYYIHTYVTFQ